MDRVVLRHIVEENHMKQNEIIKTYGTEYTKMTTELLSAAELSEDILLKAAQMSPDTGRAFIKKDTIRIGIKPNLVSCTPASYGATTHPEIVKGIIEYLHAHDFTNICIIEGSWIGDKTSDAFEYCGYNELSRKYNVPIIDTQTDTFHEVDCGSMKLNICDSVDSIDYLINVPVLKGHCQTKITCALKNMKGLIPNSEKRRFHTMMLHRPIAHLNLGIHQDFIVVDNICGDPDFEEGGNPLVRNCIMVSKDPVLTDAYVCKMFELDVNDVPYVRIAGELGVGCSDISNLKLKYLNSSPESDSPMPATHKMLSVSYAIDDIDSCSACYAGLAEALDRLSTEGLLKGDLPKICIGQGYRGQKGEYGVGRRPL